MSAVLPFSHPILVAHLPAEGGTFRLSPDAAARERLAKDLSVLAISDLTATVTAVSDGRGGVRVGGHVDGVVRQACVVTLEPFDAPVSEDIEMHFVPEDKMPEVRPGAEIEVEETDMPDPLVNGVIDLGAVVSEFFALGIDPYPRKPGVQFAAPSGPAAEASPFDVLATLRDSGPKDGG